MNIHKNARTTPQSRALMIHRVMVQRWTVHAVATAMGISERTVYKWLARYRAGGLPGLKRSSWSAACSSASPAWCWRWMLHL